LAEDNSDAERVPHSARGGPHDGQRDHLDSTLKWRPLPLIGETLVVDPVRDEFGCRCSLGARRLGCRFDKPRGAPSTDFGPPKGRSTSNRMEAGKTRTT
jgi:hypothetical protein